MSAAAAALLGFVLTLLLHASVLLGAVWLLERAGALRHPRWAELAWRGALFGALLGAGVATLGPWFAQPAANTTADVPAATRSSSGGESLAAVPSASAARPAARAPLTSESPRAQRARSASSPAVAARPVAAADPATPRRALALSNTIILLALAVWTLAATLWLARTLRRLQQVRALRRRAVHAPTPDSGLRAQADALARTLHLPPPRLHLDATLAGPVALPGGVVLLPRWSTQLPPAQTRALLAHELAHLARHDPAWRLAQHLALAPLCLHPLAWLALRRLDALAERQADATAARLLGDGRPLAECLARCLAQRAAPAVRAPRLALAMAERPGAVVDRVHRLLEEDPMRFPPPSPARTRLFLALGLAAALALPSIAVTAFADEIGQRTSISVQQDDDGREEVDITIRRGSYKLDVEMEGKITFAADESDVTAMAADAGLTIAETRDGVARSIAFRPEGGGVARDYRVEGETHAFDAAGRAWLAQALPEIFRSTGIDAEARAKRILAKGGTDALLAEVAAIRSDHGRARYLGLTFALATLDEAQQQRALALAKAIESDYELRQALSLALKSQTLGRAAQREVLALASGLGSDYELAELLIQASASFTQDADSLAQWRGLLDGMGSDYEQRRVLEALLARPEDNRGAVQLAFEAARGIGSDYERRQLLEAGIAKARDDAELRRAYLVAAAEIGSDYELRQALLALLRRGPVDAPLALATLAAIEEIGSDYECKEALVALARVMPAEPQVLERFRDVARRLGSYERGEVEKALDRRVAVG